MYLKKVELCGFKSFADKTVLKLTKGITVINDAQKYEKSNIFDAIRWCLEPRFKSIRSSHIQDVIFRGTQTRIYASMAEVSLTFDNLQNVLPIDCAEVVVTRRLFRNGKSEYFINKIQCSHKDIRYMFLDTGIGFDGYSIIDHDKIGFLATAKPEYIRALFEEVASVAKYKVRREETFKKLKKIEIDISRLSNVLSICKDIITTSQHKKQKVESLEATNLVTQEEDDTLDREYNSRLRLQQNLFKSKDDLHEVIKNINISTIENFKKTFDIVRVNFRELYRKLFDGDEADLMLIDENNLLESSIDIFVKPHGKTLQNIALCSDKQKTHIVVTLLFACFMVKPPPFCFIYEVDDPLDDRHNSLIREFVKNIQFLIVTNNKKTMKIADVLYDITTNQQGISKIISTVKLNNKES